MDNTEEFRCISLCTGYAGIELGLRRAVPALRTVCYVEVEAFACANLVSKMEAGKLDAAPVWTDIKTFDGRPFHKRVHIITAGYPCQGESVAGRRLGKADPRWLWPYIERIIETVQPVWLFGENVSGHLSLGFPTVYQSLRNLGYKVEAGLFTAAEVGAPHKRERLFILAYNEDSRFTRGDISVRQPQRQRQTTTNTLWISEMADTDRKRQQEPKPIRFEPEQPITISRWPSRPGQPQYEWEEPRVVVNAQHRRHEPKKGQIQTGRAGVEYTDKGQTQSRLGRTANRTNCRVDRLRLLGNGVVPQQAEKAFRELIKLF